MSAVFISYSADAKKWAEKLAVALRGEGLATWTDFENLSPGERIYDQLQRPLDQATFYLVVVGPRNVVHEILDIEWQGILERTWTDPDKRIIPVLIGKAKTPAFLKNWASFRLEPGRREGALVKKLAEIIKTYRPGEGLRQRTDRMDSDWQKRILKIEDTVKQLKSRQGPLLAEEH